MTTSNLTWTPSSTEQLIKYISVSMDTDNVQEWREWRNNLVTLNGKNIARCLKLETLVMLSNVLYTISQMHVKMDILNPAISDCLTKVVMYIASC